MKKLMKMKQWFLSAGLIFSACGCTAHPSLTTGTQSSANEGLYASLPFRMDKVAQPVFPDYSRSIDEFGAKADGITLNTEAINRAIRDVSEKGGGKVIVPSGLWLSGPIEILSNVNLHLEKNAILYFTADHTLYPIIKTSFEGLETRRCQSPVSARNAENIAITGYGVIDGNGDTWRPVKKGKMTASQWKKLVASGGTLNKKGDIWYPSEGSLKGAEACTSFNVPEGIETEEEWNSIRDWLRPVLVSFVKCRKVLLEGVTFKNSPSWCLHPLSCEDITVERICVSNPWYSQNGDALDLESCNRVLVTNCLFDAGDDGICLKSGKDEDGRRRGEPCQNVIIRNNVILHGHGGFVIGSEMSGGVKNVFVDNCTFLGTDTGLRFKSTRGRGGVVENIHISRINMLNIPKEGVIFDLFYGKKTQTEETENALQGKKIPEVTEKTPAFRHIFIKDVTVNGVGRAIYFNGLPEMPVKDIRMENITMTGAEEGVVMNRAENVSFKNVKIITDGNENNLKMQNTKNVSVNGDLYRETGNEMKTFSF